MADGDGGGQGAGAEELGAGGGGGGGEPPAWLADLPDELKADATLSRYADVPTLAKAHLEAHRVAKSKLSVPGEGATNEDWGKVYDALGRPKTAAEYDLGLEALPADADDAAKAARLAMETGYKDAAHGLGLNPAQAKALAAADLKRIGEAQAAFYAEGETQLNALKAEMGADYAPQAEAAKALYAKLFGGEAAPAGFADALDTKVGSGELMKGMMKLAKLMGEHGRVDGDGGELNGGAGSPQAQINAKFADKSWRDKYNAGDPVAVGEYNKLLAAATAAAQSVAG